MRRAGVLLLVAALAAAGDDPLGRVVDPRAVSLAPVEWGRYRKLGKDARVRAKGLDPLAWLRGQEDQAIEERTADWVENEYGQRPGFQFEERMEVKRRLAARLLEGKDARFLEALLRRLGEEWARFEEPLARLEGDLRKAAPGGAYLAEPDSFGKWRDENKSRFAKLQMQLALRRSELDFHGWLAREVGARFGNDETAAAALAQGLASASPRVRLFCAEAFGASGGVPVAAVAREADPAVAARMTALVKGADAVLLLEDPRWQVRAAAIEVVGRLATPEAKDLLRGRLLLEDGRLEGDLRAALGEDAPPAPAARVEFFGVPTRSRRVVFCLDVSPSMAMPFSLRRNPLPRFDMARRELQRTLEGMARDVGFGIVTFHGRAARWRPGLAPADGENKAAARALLDGVAFDQAGTNLVDAILECLDDLGPPAERFDADTIYVLSDGAPSMGPLIDTHEVVAELAVRLQGRRVTVHAIGISTDQNGELLSNLARVTGGRYVDVRE